MGFLLLGGGGISTKGVLQELQSYSLSILPDFCHLKHCGLVGKKVKLVWLVHCAALI